MASCGRLLRKISGTAGGACASRGGLETGRSRVAAGSAAPRMTLEECYLAGRFARAGLGTGCVGSFGQVRRGGLRSDLDDFLGRTASTCYLEDIDDADAVVLVGADPGVTHPVLGMRLRRAA